MNGKRTNLLGAFSPKFTPQKLAELLAPGLGVRFIRDAIKNKDHPLKHYRLNSKTILIDTDDFQEWLQAFRVDDTSDVDRLVDEMLGETKPKKKTAPGRARNSNGKLRGTKHG
jgi:hypothetical protein